MSSREQRLEKALKLVCDWSGIDPDKGNTVIALGVRDILAGKTLTSNIDKANNLVAMKQNARKPVGPR